MIVDSNLDRCELDGDKSIVFYGASKRNIGIIQELEIENRVICFVDSDKQKEGKFVDGYEIRPIEHIKDMPNVIFLSALYEHMEDVEKVLHAHGFSECRFYIPGDEPDYNRMREINSKVESKGTQYRFVHFFIDDKFFVPYYKMLMEYDEIDDHLFIVQAYLHRSDFGVYDLIYHNRNIMMMDKRIDFHNIGMGYFVRNEWFASVLDCSEKILIHSGWSALSMDKLIQRYGKKMYWIVWGGDLEFDPQTPEVKNTILNLRCAVVPEYFSDVVSSKFGLETIVHHFDYSYMPRIKKTKESRDGTIRILVGHSGTAECNHEYAFKILEKYKEYDIKVYSPLTYGEKEYIDKVVEIGDSILGKKFVPIRNHMELSEYLSFLNTMDIVLFPMKEPKANTTINYLLKMKKHIFLSKEYVGLYINEGVEAIECFNKLTFEDIYRMVETNRKKNSLYGFDAADAHNVVKMKEWKSFFERK